jgi:hypothetical protein
VERQEGRGPKGARGSTTDTTTANTRERGDVYPRPTPSPSTTEVGTRFFSWFLNFF